MAPKDALPPESEKTDQVAGGRPVAVGESVGGFPSFAEAAARLLDNGYEPLPILPGTKRPALSRWSTVQIDEQTIDEWSAHRPGHGVGLRTGRLVGLDLDILDPDLSHQLYALALRRLGETIQRVGLWPKRLLLYRAANPAPKRSVGKIELLGLGQQFVAFGRHPDTRRPYGWPDGETPLEIPLGDLPEITLEAAAAFLAEAAALLPDPGPIRQGRSRSGPAIRAGAQPIRDAAGLVTDGRDAWLSAIAFHAVHDAREAGTALDPGAITARVWERFSATTDLSRPRKDGASAYGPGDAGVKAQDKLRLLAEGRLPERNAELATTDYAAPEGTVADARLRLDAALETAMEEILAWHAGDEVGPAPRVGIKAAVGIGKSVAARGHIRALRQRLGAIGAPDRILVLTPSHGLAEESAAGWARTGLKVAVLRGYERRDPRRQQPMCLDIEAVRTAVTAGVDVHSAACAAGDRRCRLFDQCLKQANRREVAEAEVIVAPYDALWSGFAGDADGIGLILIDEACWPRAIEATPPIDVVGFMTAPPLGLLAHSRPERGAADAADLAALRRRAGKALFGNGLGPIARARLIEAGLDADSCRDAAALEERSCRAPDLSPGMTAAERYAASRFAEERRLARTRETLWRGLAEVLDDVRPRSARVRVDGTASTPAVVAIGLKQIHHTLAGKPVLQLDATLRPELARIILPGLEVTEIDAPASHMRLTLFTGGFGKSALIRDPRVGAEENRRRAAKLQACVDHVAWEARRVRPGRVLVITYKDCEGAFADVHGVETAHFNAIAGLDCWRDVALLIVVGRPLPSDTVLPPLAGALFGRVVEGGYRRTLKGVRMRDGSVRGVKVVTHHDEAAETLRAAIADDELIQAIGRGRGVNRTAADPLEVQVLADVALPLVHDRVAVWDLAAPDLVQRMLLAGVAVDSPVDAAGLHPGMFPNPEQARKAFQRGGFKGQIPIRDIYRGMSLKHAAYRRAGRGRSWSNAWWLDGDADEAYCVLADALGELAEWEPKGK